MIINFILNVLLTQQHLPLLQQAQEVQGGAQGCLQSDRSEAKLWKKLPAMCRVVRPPGEVHDGGDSADEGDRQQRGHSQPVQWGEEQAAEGAIGWDQVSISIFLHHCNLQTF